MIDPATNLPIGPEVAPGAASRPGPDIRLEGRTVALRRLDPARDAAALYGAVNGPEAARLYLYLFPPPPADERTFKAQIDTMAASDDPFALAILDQSTGEAVGHATYMRIELNHRVIEVGNILFSPALQRSPAGTEAMYLLARHAFEDLGYRRYEWKCNALNAPSRRAAERYGFRYEGTFRNHMIVKGRSRDTAWFSMIEEEWPARRAAFERWLSPDNFDASGRQRLKLSALNATALTCGGEALRRAGPSDAAAFDALQRAAYAWNRDVLGVEPLPLQVPAAEVLARYETWVLDMEDGLAGALALEPFPDHLLIWSVSVDSARQNDGVGRRLLAAAEARARDLGLRAIRLYTGEKLTKNIDWYARRGYAIERIEEMSDRRAVHMIKHVDQ